MSKPAFAGKRRDETERPIIEALRKVGFQVEQLDRPCDLLVRNPRTGSVHVLEVDGITRNRKRDKEQVEFLRDWQVPLVKTWEQAFKALGVAPYAWPHDIPSHYRPAHPNSGERDG